MEVWRWHLCDDDQEKSVLQPHLYKDNSRGTMSIATCMYDFVYHDTLGRFFLGGEEGRFSYKGRLTMNVEKLHILRGSL